jgi:hypothetical protein
MVAESGKQANVPIQSHSAFAAERRSSSDIQRRSEVRRADNLTANCELIV